MPFTKQIDRDKVEKYRRGEIIDTSDWAVGDWCYFYYRPMIDAWKESPRWTTAHTIYKKMNDDLQFMYYIINNKVSIERELQLLPDQVIAYQLAWQVFFARHVLKYEEQKIIENGDIV